MTKRVRAGLGLLVASVAMPGCDAPTLMRLTITSELNVPSEVTGLRLTIEPEGVDLAGVPEPAEGEPPFRLLDEWIPFTGADARGFDVDEGLVVDIVPYAPLGADHEVRVIVAPDVGPGCANPNMPGRVGAYQPVSRRWAFTPGGFKEVQLALTRECCGVTCPERQFCQRGICVREDGSCDDPPEMTVPCGQGACARERPRCLLGRVNDCVGQQGEADYAMCGTAQDADCNGLPDTGADLVQYPDVDGDGFGDPGGERHACGLLPNHVSAAGDCDDRSAAVRPGAAEVCDGLDNDCSGGVDEGLATPRTFGVGACACTVIACVDGVPQTCTPGPPGTEACNGIDDDCDSRTDEALTQSCAATCGGGAGSQQCVSGRWGLCAGTPQSESCNGRDDDCDGRIDEDTCTIGCDWSGSSRWVSHGLDGSNAFTTGAWVSCLSGLVSDIEWRVGPGGVSATPPGNGTGDRAIGCNWSGTRFGSDGTDDSDAFENGITFTCSGGQVTTLGAVSNGRSRCDAGCVGPARAGDATCNWSGAVWLSHGIDNTCAFRTGLQATCSGGRLTDVRWVEDSACPARR